ncbi:hypothetical protein N8T08_000640 [Aspergillus melleus]|uniref:Uncharacterized protein n=1 Tax=Aspergillus melleus TaxID=138277 RepID=A0ACC3AQW7_9EURO|nr:hypothetical protein N8T08_000640 [Aspergillus melleus]
MSICRHNLEGAYPFGRSSAARPPAAFTSATIHTRPKCVPRPATSFLSRHIAPFSRAARCGHRADFRPTWVMSLAGDRDPPSSSRSVTYLINRDADRPACCFHH